MKLAKDIGLNRSFRLALITSQAFSISNFRGPLIRKLVEKGVKVYALAPDYDEASRVAVQLLGAVPVDSSMSRTGMNPLKDISDFLRLSFQLRKLQLDMTFAYFSKPVIYGTLAACLASVPNRFAMIEGAGYVFAEENKSSTRLCLLRAFVTCMNRFSLSRVKRVFLLNSDDKDLFVNSGMVSSEKVKLLDGIGLDLEHYQNVKPILQPICFILVARLLREKGVYDYIQAVRKIKEVHPKVRFLLLGNMDLNPGSISESEVRGWVSEGLVEWPGHVSDVRIWIKQASVFVLPSYYREGLPRSTQEAMAMGKPVITTDAPGCRETVDEGVNGFIVPVRNPKALTKAMLKFIDQPELIKKMGVSSRKLAEKRFDVQKINEQILATMGI
jgi:glycosyltransferase involved in cell wall biosynthesis